MRYAWLGTVALALRCGSIAEGPVTDAGEDGPDEVVAASSGDTDAVPAGATNTLVLIVVPPLAVVPRFRGDSSVDDDVGDISAPASEDGSVGRVADVSTPVDLPTPDDVSTPDPPADDGEPSDPDDLVEPADATPPIDVAAPQDALDEDTSPPEVVATGVLPEGTLTAIGVVEDGGVVVAINHLTASQVTWCPTASCDAPTLYHVSPESTLLWTEAPGSCWSGETSYWSYTHFWPDADGGLLGVGTGADSCSECDCFWFDGTQSMTVRRIADDPASPTKQLSTGLDLAPSLFGDCGGTWSWNMHAAGATAVVITPLSGGGHGIGGSAEPSCLVEVTCMTEPPTVTCSPPEWRIKRLLKNGLGVTAAWPFPGLPGSVRALTTLADGTLLAAGTFVDAEADVFWTRLDVNDHPERTRRFPGDGATSVKLAFATDSLRVAWDPAGSGGPVRVMGLSVDGLRLWERSVSSSAPLWLTDLATTSGGDTLLAVRTAPSGESAPSRVLRLAVSGDVLWDRGEDASFVAERDGVTWVAHSAPDGVHLRKLDPWGLAPGEAGACAVLALSACNDGDPCTADTCLPESGCAHTPLDGALCLTSDLCDATASCAAGTCVTTPLACDDGDPCTTDGCEIDSGCTHAPVGGACGSVPPDPCFEASIPVGLGTSPFGEPMAYEGTAAAELVDAADGSLRVLGLLAMEGASDFFNNVQYTKHGAVVASLGPNGDLAWVRSDLALGSAVPSRALLAGFPDGAVVLASAEVVTKNSSYGKTSTDLDVRLTRLGPSGATDWEIDLDSGVLVPAPNTGEQLVWADETPIAIVSGAQGSVYVLTTRFVAHVSSSGELMAKRLFSGGEMPDIALAECGLVVGVGSPEATLWCLDDALVPRWITSLPGPIPVAVEPHIDGGIVALTNVPAPTLTHIDRTGEIDWIHTYPSTAEATELEVGPGHGFVLLGKVGAAAWVARIDASGVLVGEQTIEAAGSGWTAAHSRLGGGLVVLSSIYEAVGWGLSAIGVTALDASGVGGCTGVPVPP